MSEKKKEEKEKEEKKEINSYIYSSNENDENDEKDEKNKYITNFIENLFTLLKKYDNNRTKLKEIISRRKKAIEEESEEESEGESEEEKKIKITEFAKIVKEWLMEENDMNKVDGGGIKSKKKRHYKKSKSKSKSKRRFTKKK